MPVERAIALARTVDKTNLDNITRVVVDSKMGKVTNDPKWGYLLTPDMNKLPRRGHGHLRRRAGWSVV